MERYPMHIAGEVFAARPFPPEVAQRAREFQLSSD